MLAAYIKLFISYATEDCTYRRIGLSESADHQRDSGRMITVKEGGTLVSGQLGPGTRLIDCALVGSEKRQYASTVHNVSR
jgi:hypothetical protein